LGVGTAPIAVAVSDFNRDGAADLAVASENADGVISVLLGNGDGTFQGVRYYTAGYYPLHLAVGDLNGDGIPAMAVANATSSDVSVLLGNGDGTFQSARNFVAGVYP